MHIRYTHARTHKRTHKHTPTHTQVALMLPVLKNRLHIVKHLCEIHGANGLLAPTAGPSPLDLSQYNRAMHTVISRAAENAEQNKLQRQRHKKVNILVRPSTNHTFTTLMGTPSRAPFTQWEGAASTPSVPKGSYFDVKVQIGSCDGAILIHNETRDFCVYVEFDNCDQKTELWRRVKTFNHFEGKRAYFKAKLKKGRLLLKSEPFARDW